MKLIEAKDGDISKLRDKISDLLGKVDALTSALKDKTHLPSNRKSRHSVDIITHDDNVDNC